MSTYPFFEDPKKIYTIFSIQSMRGGLIAAGKPRLRYGVQLNSYKKSIIICKLFYILFIYTLHASLEHYKTGENHAPCNKT